MKSLRQGKRNIPTASHFTKRKVFFTREIFEEFYPGQAPMIKDFLDAK
ncbi:hypothetical protein [Butyrivibrio sp. AE2032]|nr:hypothetical protein [Butyrivibrio sp. AE2032]